MKTAGIVVVALLLCACSRTAPLSATSQAADLSRQILVTLHQPTVSGAFALVGDPGTVYLRRRGYGPSPSVNRQLDGIADDYGLRRLDGWPISSLGVYCEVYELSPGQDAAATMELLTGDSRVESAQLMNVYETRSRSYDDPYAPMQPALIDLEIDTAHEQATGRGVRVAVIDSRVDHRHPEIRGRVPVRRDLVGGRHASDGAEVHGTAIAGIIASTANNAEGIVGVAPEADIVSLRACWTMNERTGSAQCSSFSLARSLETALGLDVDIINMSLSGPHDALLGRLLDVAIGKGVIVVAALPDDAAGDNDFPASHPGVIAAAVPDAYAHLPQNALGAPGSEVLTTMPDAGYAFFSGNSMASAFVAGVSALLVERQPGISGAEVVRLLSETSSGHSINACRALAVLSAGYSGCRPAAAGLAEVSAAVSNTRR